MPGVDASHRPVIVSCDGHVAARTIEYRPYIDSQYLTEFDAWATQVDRHRAAMLEAREQNRSLFSKEGSDAFAAETGDGRDGEWDSDIRTREMEADGITCEVLFPNGAVPFGAFGETAAHHLRSAGNRAYDRWLADFADLLPGRRAALAMLAVHDLDACVAEIQWAAARGMRGVVIPTVPGDGLPPWVDPCYDAIWAACQDAALPVVVHSGGGNPNFGDYGAVSMMLYATEVTWYARRLFWHLMWAGVMERHPRPQFVWTEARCDWVPDTLRLLDGIHAQRFFSHIRETLPLRPSEYWARQCHAAASFMGPDESARRYEIGVERMMWGSDYPHIEGTWPNTLKSLRRCFRDVPIDETHTILSSNPAAIYRFDVDALQPVADRIAPTLGELTGTA